MNKFNEIINSGKPVVIDFSAEWCQPCRTMPPILRQVKHRLGDKIRILTVNVDKNATIVQKWSIQNVPTLMIFKNGELKFRQAGVLPASQLIKIIQQHL